MPQMLLLGNPRKRRRRVRRNPETRRTRSAAARRGWRHRRHLRRNPESHAERSRAARRGWAHRRRYRRNPESRAERSAASRRGWRRRRHYRRNPIGRGAVMDMLKMGGMAGLGALSIDFGMGLMQKVLPASMATPVDAATGATNWGYFAVKGGLAIALASFGRKFMPARTAEALGLGALTVVSYQLIRGVIPAGTIPLGYINPAPIVGTAGSASYPGARPNMPQGLGVVMRRPAPGMSGVVMPLRRAS